MTERGQTTLDFAIGASTFLLATAFIFAFVPGMFQPFADGGDAGLVADRSASALASDLLGNPDEPYVLDPTCTAEFFDADDKTEGCRYASDASDLSDALALRSTRQVNVTIERDDAVEYDAGRELPRSTDVVTARRAVSLEGTRYELFVRVW